MVEFNKILNSVILLSIIIVGMLFFIQQGTDNYNITGSTAGLVALNESTEGIRNVSTEFNNNTVFEGDTGTVDEGNIFLQGWSAVKVAFSSVNSFTQLVGISIGLLQLGAFGDVLAQGLVSMLLIVIFIGIGLWLIFKIKA